MALKATVSFKNYNKEIQDDTSKFIDRAVGRSLFVVERNIKANTPVVHGYLRGSITNRKTGFGKGEVFTGMAGGFEVDYAIYVEYGTMHMAPRAMFRKGIAQSEDRIKEIFAEEAKKMLK